MIRRYYFMAVKIKGSLVHASGIVTVKSFFRPPAEAVMELARRKIAAEAGLGADQVVPVSFNRI